MHFLRRRFKRISQLVLTMGACLYSQLAICVKQYDIERNEILKVDLIRYIWFIYDCSAYLHLIHSFYLLCCLISWYSLTIELTFLFCLTSVWLFFCLIRKVIKRKESFTFFFSIMKLRKHKGGREGGTFQPNQDMVIKWAFYEDFFKYPFIQKVLWKTNFCSLYTRSYEDWRGCFFRKIWTHLANLYTLSYK